MVDKPKDATHLWGTLSDDGAIEPATNDWDVNATNGHTSIGPMRTTNSSIGPMKVTNSDTNGGIATKLARRSLDFIRELADKEGQ